MGVQNNKYAITVNVYTSDAATEKKKQYYLNALEIISDKKIIFISNARSINYNRRGYS